MRDAPGHPQPSKHVPWWRCKPQPQLLELAVAVAVARVGALVAVLAQRWRCAAHAVAALSDGGGTTC